MKARTMQLRDIGSGMVVTIPKAAVRDLDLDAGATVLVTWDKESRRVVLVFDDEVVEKLGLVEEAETSA